MPAAAAAAVVAVASASGCSAASCSSAGELAEASAEQAGRPKDTAASGTAGEAEEDSDGWVDEDEEPWVARWGESLFDTHVSHSLEANVRYMRRAHSFFVPDTDSCALVDAAGLFCYLQEKVCRHHTCLFCSRPFGSAEACRDHMRDKAHCKLNLEADAAALELSEFYAFLGRPARPAGRARRGAAAPSDDDGLVGTVVAGMLPSGQRLGHRSLRQFYRQSKSFTRLYSHTGTGRIGMQKAKQQKAKADGDAAAKEAAAAAAAAEAVAAAEVAAAAAAEAGAAEARARAARGGGERDAAGGLRWSAAGPSSVRISLTPAAPQGEGAVPAAEACARGREATEAEAVRLEAEAQALRAKAEEEAAVATAKMDAATRAAADAAAAQAAAAEEETRLETSRRRLETSLALREETKKRNGALVKSAAFAKGNSKAISATYTFKEDCADNEHARALQHHGYGGYGGGAHFTMSGSRQFHKGVRIKGIAQRKAGKCKVQAARNKANRGNSSVAVKR